MFPVRYKPAQSLERHLRINLNPLSLEAQYNFSDGSEDRRSFLLLDRRCAVPRNEKIDLVNKSRTPYRGDWCAVKNLYLTKPRTLIGAALVIFLSSSDDRCIYDRFSTVVPDKIRGQQFNRAFVRTNPTMAHRQSPHCPNDAPATLKSSCNTGSFGDPGDTAARGQYLLVQLYPRNFVCWG